ncbi:hypothetical protein F1C58_14370 [Glaciihabitans sp. INWT7]|uniref:hypothetical protein n=1 Tax=Glaciihabitans sp. INWT7 TaxID=2596912 RepID=UPI00162904F3|nr:hypothetical protein [Glaciihabitans sp. INWT7]QNE47965.1 hypothetical protein F1C58_14370 [Glaciihabitans sp. INWT7]
MSDNTPETAATQPPKRVDGPDIDGEIVPAEELPATSEQEPVYDLVEVPPAAPPATLTTASPSDSEPVVATSDPAAAETTVTEREPASVPLAATSAASMQTIYVPSPVPPRRKGNRGFGVLIALLSSVVFAALYAVAIATIHAVEIGDFRFDFFGSLAYYTPIAFFFVGFVIVVLLANRASWWSYVLGSLFVGLVVYFGSVGTSLLVNNVFALTPNSAARLFSAALASPFIIAAALLAREVSMWMGALISARGRKVKVRNLEARDTFDRESAERTAEYEKSRYAAPATTI